MSLVLQRVSLPLASFTLELDLELRHPITVVFGASGSGKTSLLDLIAGLRRPRTARIEIDGQVVTDTSRGLFVPTRRRHLGYVPQDLALFPHLCVRRNLLYGHRPGPSPRFHFDPVVDLLELQPLLQRDISQLSGGEKQRVALARALLASPHLLLLDEPLANLDRPLKTRILPYLARIRDELRIPILYVTHDRFEALSLADELVVLVQGKIAQAGPAGEVFSHPANVAVAGILSVETIQSGSVLETTDDLVAVAVGSTLLSAVIPSSPLPTPHVHVCIRADDVVLTKGTRTPSSPRNHLPATVQSLAREGSLMRVDLDCGFPLTALLTRQACDELELKPGARVTALVKAPHVHLIPRHPASTP